MGMVGRMIRRSFVITLILFKTLNFWAVLGKLSFFTHRDHSYGPHSLRRFIQP